MTPKPSPKMNPPKSVPAPPPPDDWSGAFVTRSADELRAAVAARRGRGPALKPKKLAVTLRFSPDVIEYFRGTGDGWQTRIDEALKAYVVQQRE
ncbi:MAG: hypothetical protein EAZ30_09605 [Betaproteobacteria bacterium]|nr:MAG: hypothetical protein EAZ43_06910 [Betaproteobacteria bacterium]TAG47482.1 MAG: hypothetical protein EAZ30_09605 [Betaproteobacteria bacterium]